MTRQILRLAFGCILLATPALSNDWIEGRVSHVRDVDTIEVDNLPVRLNGLDGAELDERNGRAGKAWMQRLVLSKPVRCRLNGAKTYDRYVGTCYLRSGEDIGVLAVAEGFARDCPRYSNGKYAEFETPESRQIPSKSYCR